MVEARSRRSTTVQPRAAATPGRASILIIDDEELIRATLGEFLCGVGFDVATCGSAEEGLALAEQRRFDVALCDVQLPGLDGLEFLDRLQKLSPDTFVLL